MPIMALNDPETLMQVPRILMVLQMMDKRYVKRGNSFVSVALLLIILILCYIAV